MPLYEYRCAACGHRFELLQRMGEGSRGVTCPECGAAEPEKQHSTFASSVAGGSATATASACCGKGFT